LQNAHLFFLYKNEIESLALFLNGVTERAGIVAFIFQEYTSKSKSTGIGKALKRSLVSFDFNRKNAVGSGSQVP